MNPTFIFGLQIVMSLLTYSMCARWLISPYLARLQLVDAVIPLLLFHTLRTLGLIFLVPGVVGVDLPDRFAQQGAYGDLLSVVLAWSSIVALKTGWTGARVIVWVFSVVGLLDFANAFALGLQADLADQYALGVAWLIPTFAVPAFIVTHVLIIQLLLRNDDTQANKPRLSGQRA